MDRRQAVKREPAHFGGDHAAPIAALGDIAIVAETLHQHVPRLADAVAVPAFRIRFVAEAEARDRRDYQMECLPGLAAVLGRIDQWIDDVQELDDRSRPAMRHHHRQRVRMRRADVQEVNAESIDFGLELRIAVQAGFELAPVIVAAPVVHQFLDLVQLRALRQVGDRLRLRPAGGVEAALQIVQLKGGKGDALSPWRRQYIVAFKETLLIDSGYLSPGRRRIKWSPSMQRIQPGFERQRHPQDTENETLHRQPNLLASRPNHRQ